MLEFRKERMQYAHRADEDGTIDSICPRCFMTVAHSTWEADLERTERTHVCDPAWVSHFELTEGKSTFRESAKVVVMRHHA